jgi:rhamnose transport system permease protein
MNSLKSVLLRREMGILVVIILFCAVVGFFNPRFLTTDNFRVILLLMPLVMIAAMGEMLVIIARHVDLSVGSTLGFAAMMTALMFKMAPGVPWYLGFAVAIGIGAVLGLINGAMVILFRLPAIIVTLGTLYLYRGLTFIASGAKQIDRQYIPGPLKAMSANAPTYAFPWIVIIAIAVVILAYWFTNHSRLGRQIYAIGSNPTAAPLRGIPVAAVTLAVFAISGGLAGLAGIMYASRWAFVNPSNTGWGFEFQVIAAVVIGGVSINGGVGSVLGVVLGVLLLSCVSAALPLLGIPGTVQSAIYGLVIIVALVVDQTVRERGIQMLTAARGARA